MKNIEFLDLKVPVFYNKKNGQMSVSLPKRKLKNIPEGEISLRINKKYCK